ncbi:MAG: ABC transporter ATP-binding protein [Phycisphaerales bacterium]|nr:ABC transporter ATP-binding protein [Phycisphaerales bacterium]
MTGSRETDRPDAPVMDARHTAPLPKGVQKAPSVPIVDLESVSRVFRGRTRVGHEPAKVKPALDGVTARLKSGQWIALLGANGSGKSTLLRLIAGVDAPTSGSVKLFGIDASRASTSVRRAMGVVFQSASLDPLLTVRENLAAHAAIFGVPSGDIAKRVEALAAEVGLQKRLNDRVGTLSGGLMRRADLARALLPEPHILLLDEPVSGLDAQSIAGFLDTIARRHAPPRGMTIVMSTHQFEAAARADRVMMLDGGRLVADDSPAALVRALGQRIITTEPAGVDALRNAGLEVLHAPTATAGWGTVEPAERAAAELTRRGIPYQIAPPTLADAYRLRTGAQLDRFHAEVKERAQ